MAEKRIGFETPEERVQRLVRDEIASLQKRLAAAVEEELEALRHEINSLGERLQHIEETVGHLTTLGHYKRINCKHNIGGICRTWGWDSRASVAGLKITKVAETGKFHPEPDDAWCAPCIRFERAGK